MLTRRLRVVRACHPYSLRNLVNVTLEPPLELRAEQPAVVAGEHIQRGAADRGAVDVRHDLGPGAPTLRFEVDESDGRVVVHVVDRDTGEILRTVPPSATLNLQKRLGSELGLLVDAQS